MAANAFSVPMATADTNFWNRFRCLAERRVSEGNVVAGERLWELVPSSGWESRFIVRSTKYLCDCVECSLDLESGFITCTPGSATDSSQVRFQLLEGKHGKLRRDGVECTIDQAVAWILDQLVWVEDCDGVVWVVPDSEGR